MLFCVIFQSVCFLKVKCRGFCVHFYVVVSITGFSIVLNAIQCTLGSKYVYLCSAAVNSLKRVLQVTSYLNDLLARQVKMKERVKKLKEGLRGRLPCRSKARRCLNLQANQGG